MKHSHDDPWQPLLTHLERNSELSQLRQTARDQLVSWIQRSGPFQNAADLQARLRKAKIKGLNKQQRQALAESLQYGLGRRAFLATIGAASAVSLGAGIRGWQSADKARFDALSIPLRPMLAAFQQQQLTIGQAVARFAAEIVPHAGAADVGTWRQFLHALDMSNWLEAAMRLTDDSLDRRMRKLDADNPAAHLAEALQQLLRAWNYLLSTKSEWEDEYFVAYALGKMPALATADPTESPIPDFAGRASESAAAIHELAPLFHALEVFNQRFQLPGQTINGASVRVTQGHNFSYAHLAEDLLNQDLFPPDSKKVLVNWDAHADLSGPFENPRMPIDAPFDVMQGASKFAERVVVASSMSISGWILPLIYQRLLSSIDQVSHVVWVVPKEAQQTSRNYMESYGEYSFVVGDWRLPDSASKIIKQSTTSIGDWNIPGTKEVRKYGDRKTLRSVVEQGLLDNQRECKLHIVDPDNLSDINHLVADVTIALSIDADFAGTREPGLAPRQGFLPHYPLTGSPESQARHKALMGQLAKFVESNGRRIRTVSVANSPNFTVAEESRKPVAKILQIVTGGADGGQPDWIANELARIAPADSSSNAGLLNGALALGGLSGLFVTAATYMRDRRRLREVHSLLFSDKNSGV